MQMVMVLFLILKEYLPIPFQDDPRYVDFTDRFQHQKELLVFVFCFVGYMLGLRQTVLGLLFSNTPPNLEYYLAIP